MNPLNSTQVREIQPHLPHRHRLRITKEQSHRNRFEFFAKHETLTRSLLIHSPSSTTNSVPPKSNPLSPTPPTIIDRSSTLCYQSHRPLAQLQFPPTTLEITATNTIHEKKPKKYKITSCINKLSRIQWKGEGFNQKCKPKI